MDKVVACQTCGLVQEVGEVPNGCIIKCARCNFQIFHRRVDSRLRTLALALAAGILYFPSNLYPIVTAEYQGQFTQTTIFQGIRALWQDGQYFISGLVFCTSIFTPALKIIGLIFITLTLNWTQWKKTRTWIYKVIQWIDPWNMLEVFLLAICVSMVEMGEVATVHPGRGVFSFAAVVVLTLLATYSFDPRLLWDSPEEKRHYE
ncbi:MAG TPA: paraquat-inducible protein A [Verrucomicrobiae bacterium]|nr:paraquat-inducible protein A [Verrucomicrobiae bacterium]